MPSPSLPAELKNVLDAICREQENGRLSLSDGKAEIGGWELMTDEKGYLVSLENSSGKIEFEDAAAL